MQGIIAADLDRADYQVTRDQAMDGTLTSFLDSDLDLIIWGTKGVQLLENVKDPNTTQRTLIEKSISEDMQKLGNVEDVAIADLDHDGDLDLALSSEQAVSGSNRGDWTFEKFTAYSHLPKPDQQNSTHCSYRH